MNADGLRCSDIGSSSAENVCDVAIVAEICALACCERQQVQEHGGRTEITDAPAIVYKGEFKHAYLPVQLSYQSPTGHTGPIDLIPVVRSSDGSPATGVVDGSRTLVENARTLRNLQPTGSVNVNIRFLSGALEGGYSVTFIIKPTGADYSERYRSVVADSRNFNIVTEYIRLDGEDAELGFTAHLDAGSGRPTVATSFSYLAATPVKFAIQIRCFVPPSRRVGDLSNCDNFPRFFNTYSIPEHQFGSANIETGPTSVTLTAKMFSSVSRDPRVPFKIDVSMGRFSPAGGAWLETRDRTDRVDLTVASAARLGSFEGDAMAPPRGVATAPADSVDGNSTSEPPSAGGGGFWVVSLLLGGLVVAVLAAVVMAAMFRRRSIRASGPSKRVGAAEPPKVTSAWASV